MANFYLLSSRYLILMLTIIFTSFIYICKGQEVEPTKTLTSQPLVATFRNIALCYDSCNEALRVVLDARLNSMPCDQGSQFLETIDTCENCVERSADQIDYIFNNDIAKYIRDCIEVNSSPQIVSAKPAETACLSICKVILAKWIARVDSQKVDTLEDCRRLRDQNEIYALEKCSSIRNCINIPKEVSESKDRCNVILHDYEVPSQSGQLYENDTTVYPTKTTEVSSVFTTPKSSERPQRPRTSSSTTQRAELSSGPKRLDRSQVIGISVAVSIALLVAAGVGILLIHRKRKLMESVPELPLPYPEMPGGLNKFPSEMSAVRSLVEIETATEHTTSCAELEAQIPDGLQTAQCSKTQVNTIE